MDSLKSSKCCVLGCGILFLFGLITIVLLPSNNDTLKPSYNMPKQSDDKPQQGKNMGKQSFKQEITTPKKDKSLSNSDIFQASKDMSELSSDTNKPNRNITEPHRYIHMPSKGRLGNVMWQVAALYGLSHRTGRTGVYHLPNKPYCDNLLDNFPLYKLGIEVSNQNALLEKIKHGQMREINEDTDMERLNHLPSSDVVIYGYFINSSYWREFAEDIKREFQFSQRVISTAHKTILKIKSEFANKDKLTLIGVHVRRGDFIILLGEEALPKPGYFRNAMDYYIKKFPNTTCIFLIFSDDLLWCKCNLNFPERHIYFIENQTAYEDMETLRQCEHIIASRGTFSWWAGFLAGGSVTYHVDTNKQLLNDKQKQYIISNETLHNVNAGSSYPADGLYPERIPVSD